MTFDEKNMFEENKGVFTIQLGSNFKKYLKTSGQVQGKQAVKVIHNAGLLTPIHKSLRDIKLYKRTVTSYGLGFFFNVLKR